MKSDYKGGDIIDERIIKLIYKNAYSCKESTNYIYDLLMQVADGNDVLKKTISKYIIMNENRSFN